MKSLKLIYVISDIDQTLAFEWISMRLPSEFDFQFVLIGRDNPKITSFFRENKVRFKVISDSVYPSFLSKVVAMTKIIRCERPDIIHSHLWRANLIALPVAWLQRVRKRIFTRHHGTIHYNEFPSGRKWDRLVNFLATDIVAISENVREILVDWDKADPKKITIIRHGFDLNYFKNVPKPNIESVRERQHIPDTFPRIGIIARYLEWKGIHFLIDAFRQLRASFPAAHLVLSNTKGNFAKEIRRRLSDLPDGSYTEIDFEVDVAALYQTFDIYVHVPTDPNSEAFGQTYIEALAAGIPSIFTLSGIAREFIKDEFNALVVDFRNSEAIHAAIMRLLADKELSKRLVENGKQSVPQFELDNMIDNLINLYHK
jgi:glycosyltransferase involved in cell wall biosynthesis